MCGILGIVGRRSSDLPAPEAFKSALDLIAHRGPDDEGTWSEGDALLGHRRLSILDLSPAGHQPMVSASGRYIIVFNGEVYNFQTLRAELERDGVRFRSHSDTEVILELYAREGPSCVERMRGMFAIAIWDKFERQLFLVRDRLGIKPLYVWSHANGLAFSSELKAIRALPGAPRALSHEALFGYLAFGSVPTPWTMFEGVRSLRPGCWTLWKDGRAEEGRYWSLPRTIQYRTRGEAIEALRPALREAVRLRCIADVPVGAFLSGGIDSSAVVALMRDVGHGDVRTLSIVFPGTDLDEAHFAEQIARRYDTNHCVMEASESTVRENLDGFFNAMDQPSLDGVNTYVVSALARQSGLTVALSGLGGDEVFGGYASFRRAALLDAWLKHVPHALRSAAGALGSRLHPRLAKLDAFDVRLTPAVQSYLISRGLFSSRQVTGLLCPEMLPNSVASFASTLDVDDRSPFHVTMALELGWYMHDQLLRDTDVFGMAHGLEIRVPLIDHKVVEIVSSTDSAIVTDGHHKALLRDALPAPLPAACVERSKMGFTFPFDEWMRTSWRKTVQDQLMSAGSLSSVLQPAGVEDVWTSYLAGRTHWSRPWALYVLSRWMQTQLAG